MTALASSGSGEGDVATTDVLSDVLRSVRLTGALFFPMTTTTPWLDFVPDGSTFAPVLLPGAQSVISYHIVRRGQCWAGLADGPPIRLETGDILVLPHGDAYFMSSAPDLRSGGPGEPALDFFREMAGPSAPLTVTEGGGESPCADIVCGFLGCDVRPFNPVLGNLPRLIHLRQASDEAGRTRLSDLIEFALLESRQPRPGARCVLLRLSEVLFVEVVRRYLVTLESGQGGWLAGLRDPLVGRALALLHDRPTEPWTLHRLARSVGASRSLLSDRFTGLVGLPPMHYLTQWRLQLAARILADGTAKVSAVAAAVGYGSESAFSRAFRKFVGTPPSAWRRHATSG